MKGLTNTINEVTLAIIMLFIAVFIISYVIQVTSIESTSPIYSTFTYLTEQTPTIFKVLVALVIIAAIAVLVWYVRTKMASSMGAGTAAV